MHTRVKCAGKVKKKKKNRFLFTPPQIYFSRRRLNYGNNLSSRFRSCRKYFLSGRNSSRARIWPDHALRKSSSARARAHDDSERFAWGITKSPCKFRFFQRRLSHCAASVGCGELNFAEAPNKIYIAARPPFLRRSELCVCVCARTFSRKYAPRLDIMRAMRRCKRHQRNTLIFLRENGSIGSSSR